MNGPFIHLQKQTMPHTNLQLMLVGGFGEFQLQTVSEIFFILHTSMLKSQTRIGRERTRLGEMALFHSLYLGLLDLTGTNNGTRSKLKNTRTRRPYSRKNIHRQI